MDNNENELDKIQDEIDRLKLEREILKKKKNMQEKLANMNREKEMLLNEDKPSGKMYVCSKCRTKFESTFGEELDGEAQYPNNECRKLVSFTNKKLPPKILINTLIAQIQWMKTCIIEIRLIVTLKLNS